MSRRGYSVLAIKHEGSQVAAWFNSLGITAFVLKYRLPDTAIMVNPSTIINYQVPASGLVTIKVYDVLGREIQTLVNEIKNPGRNKVKFNGSNLASGLYLYRITSKNFTSTKKMLLMK